MNKIFEKLTQKPSIFMLAQICTGVIAFRLLLLIPPHPFISHIFYRPNWQVLITFFVFFALLFHQHGKGWETLSVIGIFGLFAIPFIYEWQFAAYDANLIGGLLPWSDASNYYWEAYRLINGSLVSTWGGRRPLFIGLLASILRLSGGNFTATLIILTLMNTLAVLIALYAIKRWYGAIGAAAYLLIAYEFYTRFTGKTLTEQMGFTLANLALFFLLVGVMTKSFWRALLGLGILTIALNARAGAFFILPALLLWLTFYFSKQIIFWRAAVLATAVATIAFLLNIFLTQMVTGQKGTAFSNYSYTLYGLASGNKGWTQVIQDHPTVAETEVMALAIQKIQENPVMLLYGIGESYKDYFKTYGGAFSFISLGAAQSKANLLLWIFVLVGLFHSWLKRETGAGSLVLISFSGVLASLSLLPPIDADSMRAFAATIPFTGLWVAAGVSAIATWGREKFLPQGSDPTEEIGRPFQRLALGLSVLILALAVLGPLILIAVPTKPWDSSTQSVQSSCGSSHELIRGIVFEATSIRLIPNDAALESYVPFIRLDDFRNAFENSHEAFYPILEEELSGLQAGTIISFGAKLDDTQTPSAGLWMISTFPVEEGEFTACGHATGNQWLRNYNFYYLKGADDLPFSLAFSQEYLNITLIIRLLYGLGVGLVLFLIIKNTFNLKRYSLVNYLYIAGVLILVVQSILMGLYVQGKLPISSLEQRITLRGKDAMPNQGHLYLIPLGTTWMDQATLGISPARVYEDGIPLTFANSIHQTISEIGNGRYSFWQGYLYFSTSDNSDPRTNRRMYEIIWPRPIPPALQWLSYLLGICGVAGWLLAYRKAIDENGNL